MQLLYHEGNRGMAEKVRLMLAECGYHYEEVAVAPRVFDELKANETLNWGVLPALRDGDVFVEQSNAIMEYLADKADASGKGQRGNLYSGAAQEKYAVRAVAQAATEFQMIGKCWKGKAAAPPNFASEMVPDWFSHFQLVLKKNDDDDVRTEEFTIGKNFTYADITMFEAVNAVTEVYGMGCLRAFPKLKEFHDKVAGRARIDKHMQTRAPDNHMA